MNQPKGQGSFWDVAAFCTRVMDYLEPMIEESFDRLAQGTLDRQSIAWTNMQVQKHRERREHREQRRFISDQPVSDPTIPPGGAQPDLILKVNALVGGVDGVAKQLCDLREQLETLSDRVDAQFAYTHRSDAWLKDDEAEEEEVEAPDN